MSTLYQSSKDVPTEVLSARLDQLSDVVSSNRERIDDEFTMRIPAEVDRDADLVMSEAAVRLEALQAECEKLRKDADRYRWLRRGGDDDIGVVRGFDGIDCGSTSVAYTYEEGLYGELLDAAIDAALADYRKGD